MYQQRMAQLILSLFLVVLLFVGCAPAPGDMTAVDPTAVPAPSATAEPTQEPDPIPPQPAAPTAEMDPLEVTQAFYDWYLAYSGDRSSGDFRNPLVDQAYHDNPLLTPEFIARVDETLAGFEGGGYDPFLQAQDIPQDMFGTWSLISGDKARVTVLRSWDPPNMDAIFAHLRRDSEVWLIDDITAVELYEPTAATPEGAVQQFYSWYTDALRRRFIDDTVEVDFHNSDLLTDGFKQQLDDIRAAAEAENPDLGLHYDPLLCAQDVPYHVTPDQALITGDTAALTARSSFPNHIIAIDLQATEGGWRISDVTCTNTSEATAKAFYTWYLGYIGDWGSGDFRNPLADKAYRGHTLLSESFVQEVDAMFDTSGGIGHDPFLQAQDVPSNFTVEPGSAEGTAVVHFQFGPDFVHDVQVIMIQEGGRWLIAGIEPAEDLPAGSRSSQPTAEMDPAAVTQAFYTWYLAYIGDRSSGDFRNPLVDQVYQDNDYLTPGFIADVDELLAGLEGGGYDPFLCAQDIPGAVVVDGAIYTLSGAKAALHSDFANHAFVAELEQAGDGAWQINNVVCPGTPQSNAAIFYTWYLAYTRNCCLLGLTDPYQQRSPLADGVYHEAPYINPAYAGVVDAELEQMHALGGSGYDPILQAQAFPPDFTVEAGEEEGTVVVDMAFANPHRLEVQMQEVGGQWLVSSVTLLEEPGRTASAADPPDTSGWQTVIDPEHAFRFQIPPDWVAQEQNLQGPGMPDDWPVLQQYLLMPAELAQDMAARSSPPAGDEMPLVPPITISYLQGDQAAFDCAFVPAAFTDTLQMNGQEILVQRQAGEYPLPRYVFQDKQDLQRLLVVEDLVNEFPGREEQAAAIFDILDGILMTISFTE